MKILHLNFIVILFFAVSCGEKKQTESKTDALLDKVMAVHDEVMPKMSDIMRLKKELNAKVDELLAAGEDENSNKITELKKAIENLDNSNEGMMSWMREFDRNFEGKVEEEGLFFILCDKLRRFLSKTVRQVFTFFAAFNQLGQLVDL